MALSNSDHDQELRQEARKRAQVKLSFFGHLAIYGVVNIFLAVVNLLTAPDALWFYWPLLGWGVGLVAHGIAVYATHIGQNLLGRLEKGEMDRLRKASGSRE